MNFAQKKRFQKKFESCLKFYNFGNNFFAL